MNAPQQQLVETTFPLPDQIVLNASITPSPVQPDALGEFPTPLDGALFMAGFDIPQIPLRGKAPFLKNWTEAASTDPGVILAWSLEHPSCNFGSMAVRGSHFIFDADKPKDAGVPVVRERFQALGQVAHHIEADHREQPWQGAPLLSIRSWHRRERFRERREVRRFFITR